MFNAVKSLFESMKSFYKVYFINCFGEDFVVALLTIIINILYSKDDESAESNKMQDQKKSETEDLEHKKKESVDQNNKSKTTDRAIDTELVKDENPTTTHQQKNEDLKNGT